MTNFYRQLKSVYLIKLPPSPILRIEQSTYVALALIHECKGPVAQHPSGLNMHTYKKLECTEVVDITTVKCLVGRAQWLGKWVIFDRSSQDYSSDNEEDNGEAIDED